MTLKKMIIIDLIIVAVVLIISSLFALLSGIRMTDIFFIGFLIMLSASAAELVLARRKMHKAVRKQDSETKKAYKQAFQQSEKYAFNFFGVSLVLLLISILLATV